MVNKGAKSGGLDFSFVANSLTSFVAVTSHVDHFCHSRDEKVVQLDVVLRSFVSEVVDKWCGQEVAFFWICWSLDNQSSKCSGN